MKMKMFLTLVFLILKSTRCSTVIDDYSQQASLVSNYCEKTNYCEEGTHVMCMYHNKDRKIGPACHSYVSTTMTSEMVDQILDIVNNIRSKAASGMETGKNGQLLPRAYGMMLMKWDHELATFAQVLADQCFGGREDECRATSKFPHPSQGSGIIQFKFPDWQYLTMNQKNESQLQNKGLSQEKLSFAIDRFFKATYALKKTVTSEMITKCPSITDLPDTKSRYFFNLIRGTASHIGCGISAYTRFNNIPKTKQSIYNAIEIVCNFSDRPQPSEPLYTSDPPVPGDGFSAECGCPDGYKESSGCLCEENRTAVWPKFALKEREKVRTPNKVVWKPNTQSQQSPLEPKPQQPVIRIPVVKNTIVRPKVQSWTKLQQLQTQTQPQQTQKQSDGVHLPKLANENEVRSDIVKMLQLIKKKAILQALNKSESIKTTTEKKRAKIISTGKELPSIEPQASDQETYKEMPRFMTILENLAKEVQNYQFDQDKKEYFDSKMKNIFETVQFNYKDKQSPPSQQNYAEDDEEDEGDKDFNNFIKFKREGEYLTGSTNSIRQRTEADTPISPEPSKEQENNVEIQNIRANNVTEPEVTNVTDTIDDSFDQNPFEDAPLDENNESTVTNNTIGHEGDSATDTTDTSSSETNSQSAYKNLDPFDRNDGMDMESMSFKSNNEDESYSEPDIDLPTNRENTFKAGPLSYFDSAKRRARTNRVYRRVLDHLHPLKHAWDR